MTVTQIMNTYRQYQFIVPQSEELRVALIGSLWLIMRNIQHYILTVSFRYIFYHSCSALLTYPFRQTNTYQTPPLHTLFYLSMV